MLLGTYDGKDPSTLCTRNREHRHINKKQKKKRT